MKTLYPIIFVSVLLLSGCSNNTPRANSNLHNVKAQPVVNEPKSTRSFWNWFGDGLSHTTLQTYRDRRWMNSRDRMMIDYVGEER